MKKNLLATKQNIKVILLKTKSLMEITNKILGDKIELTDDDWIQRLWEWADRSNALKRIWIDGGWNYPDQDISFGEYNTSYILPGWRGFPEYKKELLNLTELLFSRYELNELPKEIGKLVNLEILDLRENSLSELPKEIGQLRNLRYLSVWCNNLITLPKEIGELTKLEELDLICNPLTSLPKEIEKLVNLQSLKLTDTNLTKLPKEIVNLTNITWLELEPSSNLILTKEQKEWIDFLVSNNGCRGPYNKIY